MLKPNHKRIIRNHIHAIKNGTESLQWLKLHVSEYDFNQIITKLSRNKQMKYYFAIALAIIASLFTGCSQVASAEDEWAQDWVSCEEEQAYYDSQLKALNECTSPLCLTNNMDSYKRNLADSQIRLHHCN